MIVCVKVSRVSFPRIMHLLLNLNPRGPMSCCSQLDALLAKRVPNHAIPQSSLPLDAEPTTKSSAANFFRLDGRI